MYRSIAVRAHYLVAIDQALLLRAPSTCAIMMQMTRESVHRNPVSLETQKHRNAVRCMAGPSRPSVYGGTLIAKKYRLLGQIGEGSFGVICLGKDVESREQVAIKIESQHSSQPKTLLEEARLLKALHRVCEDGKAVGISLSLLKRLVLKYKLKKPRSPLSSPFSLSLFTSRTIPLFYEPHYLNAWNRLQLHSGKTQHACAI